MKNLITIFIFLFTFLNMYGQSSIPITPIFEQNEITKFKYDQNKIYNCDSWLESYMLYYNSHFQNKVKLLSPIEMRSLVKSKTDINHAVLVLNTYEINVIEVSQNTNLKELNSKLDTFKMDGKLPISTNIQRTEIVSAGIEFPHYYDSKSPLTLSLFTLKGERNRKFESIDVYDNNILVGNIENENDLISFFPSNEKILTIKCKTHLNEVLEFKIDYKKQISNLDNNSNFESIPYTETSPIPVGPEYDDECRIKPTYYNNPFTGLPYKAFIPFQSIESDGYWTTYYPNGEEDFSYDVFVPNSYEINSSTFGEFGQVETAVYKNPFHDKVRNPIIITDGIDFGNTRKLGQIFDLFGGNEMLQTLWDGGYDLILCNWLGGADYMQRNAFALNELIRSLKQEQGVTEIAAIVGPSMGGEVCRYSLMYWEKNLSANFGSHNVKNLVFSDAPIMGANIAPSLTTVVEQLKNFDPAIIDVDEKLNTPAARQLLLNHAFGKTTTTTYTPGSHKYRELWSSELEDLGNFPTQCKLISIAQGSGFGNSSSASACENIISANGNISFPLPPFIHKLGIELKAVENNCKIVGFKCNGLLTPFLLDQIFNYKNISLSSEGIKTTGTTPNYDSYPGSPFILSSDMNLPPNIPIVVKGFTLTNINIEHSDFTFIPTFSALGIDPTNVDFNISSLASTANSYGGFSLNGSPFDEVYFDNTNSHHVNLDTKAINFLLGSIGYKKRFETRCLILEKALSTFNNIKLSSNTPVQKCLPFAGIEFSLSYANCNIFTEADDQSIIFKTTSQDDCIGTMELCLGFPGCPNICKTISVEVESENDMFRSNSSEITNPIISNIEFNLYPNPTNGIFEIRNPSNKKINIEVINSLGQIVFKGDGNHMIDLSSYRSGIYFVKVLDESKNLLSTEKLLLVD